MSTKKLTPMQEQYEKVKKEYPGSVILIRVGDFYEGFGEDAKTLSKVLGITLTSRDKKSKIAMAGFPHHALDQYLPKLVDAGYKAVVLDQVEDPSLAKGVVKRAVTKVVTPGTLVDSETSNESRYIAAVLIEKKRTGFAYADLATGDLFVTEFNVSDDGRESLMQEIKRLSPKQLVVSEDSEVNLGPEIFLEKLEVYYFAEETARQKICDMLGLKNLAGFGLEKYTSGVSAVGALLHYLEDTQKTDLKHFVKITPYSLDDKMHIDASTIRNLELFFSSRGNPDLSLYGVLNQTQTGMGARLLKRLILSPLIDKTEIIQRLDAVEALHDDEQLLDEVREVLSEVYDLQRLSGKIGLLSVTPKDFLSLRLSVLNTGKLAEILKNTSGFLIKAYLKKLQDLLSSLNSLAASIEETIDEEAGTNIALGGYIRSGVSPEIDELREAMRSGKGWIQELEATEREKTGISSLKVKFNKVFGYYIEISKSNLDKVPEDYIRKQTLVNAERFITPELKDVERKVLGAEDRLLELEFEIFSEFREEAKKYLADLQALSEVIANIDVISNFAYVASESNFCKPVVYDFNENSGRIDAKSARHPVVEKVEGSTAYVPNDICVDNEKEQLVILTGPNMAGKSTYIRQVALLSIMAQIGSFVPATSAEISLVDKVFTRVGASDNLSEGQSTFMVEMTEAANIANNATKNSLVILDEVGRGTSTYDGVSIAWSLAEYIHEKIGAKTFFATHYHELLQLEEKFDRIVNYNVEVRESGEEVVFLRSVKKGGTDQSYGIYVAKLSGMPGEIISRANQILGKLEETSKMNGKTSADLPQTPVLEVQQSLFNDDRAQKLLDMVEGLDPDSLTPKEALDYLYSLKKETK